MEQVQEEITDPVHGYGWNTADRWGGWDWREPRYGDFFRTCSFCGCIHPEDLVAEPAASGPKAPCMRCGGEGWEACFRSQAGSGEEFHSYNPGGWHASWADRKYGWPHKFYVEGLYPRDPKLLHCTGHASHVAVGSGSSWGSPDSGVAAGDLTEAQKEIIRKDGMNASGKFEGIYQFTPKHTLHAKFYTTHLADPRVSEEIKAKIASVSGLAFRFEGGRVSWSLPD